MKKRLRPRKPRLRVYPYKQGSRSAKELAIAANGMVLKHVGSKYRPRADDVVVNWGAGDFAGLEPATTLNPGVKIQAAANKLTAFEIMENEDVRVPPFERDAEDAARNLQFPVVCRTKLTGHSGEGIVIAENPNELVRAPLYTQYVKKKDEYRVHIMSDCPFFVQRKARRLDVEDPDWRIRNLKGGFVFVEVDQREVPEDVLQQARQALQALELDFGGVDVIWNEREGRAYVLEVNTACGLEERTARCYADEILRLFPSPR